MSIINNGLLLASGADAATTYQISRSLRFNSADSPRLARTPGSAGNRKTWTLSCWVKRSKIGSGQQIFSAWSGSGTTQKFSLAFYSDDKLNLAEGSGVQERRRTTQVFRDVGAWFHLVVVADTTLATANDRYKIYVNGSQITTFDITNNPAQNDDTAINQAAEHVFGCQVYGSGLYNDFYDGYLADIYLLDGTATTPSTFAETDAVTGQWVPKTPTGISYGTNGFHLTFSDNSGTTSTTLGNDVAGSNDWTPNNFSVASGSGNDSLTDSPTSYGTDTGAGSEVRGNYATFNPLDLPASGAYSNGNLEFNHTAGNGVWRTGLGTIAISSGKWYWEMVPTVQADAMIGIVKADWSPTANSSQFWDSAGGYGYLNNGLKYNNASSGSYGASFTTNDVIGVALDLDAGTLVFYKNGSSQGTAYTGLSGSFKPAYGAYFQSKGIANFGARAFSYQAPSGFKALCDTNLTAPTIALPNTVMDVKLWTGNGGTQTISGLGFSPDFVWIKSRSAAYNHRLLDTIRGATKELYSSTTDAETTQSQSLTAFNSDGFSLGTLAQVNESSTTFAGWCWDAGSSTVTNTQGSITSSVRANASAGFSIVTYTGNLSGAGVSTVGHGLGVAPSMVITKRRDGASNWCVQHISTSTAYQILFLDTTDAEYNTSSNGTLSRPTSTVFSINNSTGLGVNGQTHVAYAFAPVAGYSSMGSYVGNGSSDGVFVYTGFRPKWVMIKASSSTGDWYIIDTSRDTYNLSGKSLQANTSNAEPSVGGSFSMTGDILSNGFKLRDGGSGSNGSSVTYVWAAFAESPFQYARAR